MPCVSIEGLSLTFDRQQIFQDFNFILTQGHFTSLLGASGVGKSTLLRVIVGLETSFDGTMSMAHGTILAYMAQQDALYPWLSVLDNVQLYAHLSGKKSAQIQDKALYLLHEVKMTNHLHKRPYELSGGQRQRVALARTLMSDANLVLMDEPFSALDAITRHELQTLSHHLLKDKTVLLITHDPQEAVRLSDDIYILKHQPATIVAKISPNSRPIRGLDDVEFAQLHTQLLSELSGSVL